MVDKEIYKKTIYTVADVQNIVSYRSRLSEWLIKKTIYAVNVNIHMFTFKR